MILALQEADNFRKMRVIVLFRPKFFKKGFQLTKRAEKALNL